MRLVVGGVHVSPIPTGREGEFDSDAIRAVGVDERLIRHEMAAESVFVWFRVVMQAVETKSFLLESFLSKVRFFPERRFRVGDWPFKISKTRVSGNHLEAGWKRCYWNGIRKICAEEVVSIQTYKYSGLTSGVPGRYLLHSKASNLGHRFKNAIMQEV